MTSGTRNILTGRDAHVSGIWDEEQADGTFVIRTGYKPLDLAALDGIEPQARQFAIAPIVPLAEVTLLAAGGGEGKTTLSLQLGMVAAALLSGVPPIELLPATLGLKVMPCPVVYFTAEDSEEHLHFVLRKICDGVGIGLAHVAGALHIVCRRGELDNELGRFDHEGQFAPSPTFEKLRATIDETGAQLVVLDNLAHLFSGNENDRHQVTQFTALLSRLARDTGAAIVVLGHPPKSDARYSGSTAWEAAARSRVEMNSPDELDPDLRALSLGKANYARRGEVARFRWVDWRFVRDEDLPPSVSSQLREVSRAGAANEAFLACLAEATEQGRNVSHNPSSNYAPRVFAKMPKGKGFSLAEFEAAMERLLHLGAILADQEVGKYGNRAPKRGLVAAQSPAQNGANQVPKTCTEGAQSAHKSAHNTVPSPTEREGGATDWPPPSPPDPDWADEPPAGWDS